MKTHLLRFWRSWLRPFVVAAAIVFPFKSAIAEWNIVPSGSMKPTILEGDFVFVNKLAYDLRVPFTKWRLSQWGDPARGDIVVCFSPADGKRLVKRVIGIPGDVIELRDNRLFVNGKSADYRPLDQKVTRDLTATEKSQCQFAEEGVEDRSHAVMAQPRVLAPRSFPPLRIPSGKYFMMGDNRDVSGDSRYFGFIERKQIVGQATRVLVSFDPEDWYLPRADRTFEPLR